MPEIWPDLSSCLMKDITFSHKVFRFWTISVETIYTDFIITDILKLRSSLSYSNWMLEFQIKELSTRLEMHGKLFFCKHKNPFLMCLFPGRIKQPRHSIFTYTAFQAADQQ